VAPSQAWPKWTRFFQSHRFGAVWGEAVGNSNGPKIVVGDLLEPVLGNRMLCTDGAARGQGRNVRGGATENPPCALGKERMLGVIPHAFNRNPTPWTVCSVEMAGFVGKTTLAG